jgi:hypothetical protein
MADAIGLERHCGVGGKRGYKIRGEEEGSERVAERRWQRGGGREGLKLLKLLKFARRRRKAEVGPDREHGFSEAVWGFSLQTFACLLRN